MSQLTNYGENKLADYMRGQGLPVSSSWYLSFLTAWSDASVTEATGIGLSRVQVPSILANWAGTQGPGTTLASTGTSHTTSNNNSIAMGTASGSAEAIAVGLFDASSSGNCWMVFELGSPLDIAPSDTPSLSAGLISFTLGIAGGMSDYLANKVIDALFRGQSYSWPATMYCALLTAAPSNAGGGTEVGGGVGYARTSLAASMSAISGTQSAGSTTASSGTAGRISNNAALALPAPSGDWGTADSYGFYDASTLGNLLFWRALTSPRTISAGGDPPQFPANACGFTFA